eukprot:COSAG06_NODE_392_length_16344_cov_4.086981_8_plen_1386_part_00
MSAAADANSLFQLQLRGRDAMVPGAKKKNPDGNQREVKAGLAKVQAAARGLGLQYKSLQSSRARSKSSGRTLDLLHKGYGTIGVGRLQMKPVRRTGWKMVRQDAHAAGKASALLQKFRSQDAEPQQQRPNSAPAAPASAPRASCASPLARRRRRAAEGIKQEAHLQPHELPMSRATWIVTQETTSRRNTSISFDDALAPRPSTPRPDPSEAARTPRHDGGAPAANGDSPLSKPEPEPEPEVEVEAEPESEIESGSPVIRTIGKDVRVHPEGENIPALRAEVERLHKLRRDKSLTESERAEFDSQLLQAQQRLAAGHDRLAKVVASVTLMDKDGDGIIDAFEMHAALDGRKSPTRPFGGRTAELATPKHRRQSYRERLEMYHVGDGDATQQHEEIGCGWVRVLELSGDVYYWNPRLKKSQWNPPPHADPHIQEWKEGRGAMSAATLASLTRRRELIKSGRPAAEMRQREAARLRREMAELRKEKLMEQQAQAAKKQRLEHLKKQAKMSAWFMQLEAEAHARFVEYVTKVQAKWRSILLKRIYKQMRANQIKLRSDRMKTELMGIRMIQRHTRGFLARKRLRYLWATPFAIYIILGAPGSGKTALGRRLAEAHGMIRLSPAEIIRTEVRKAGPARATSFVSDSDYALMRQCVMSGDIFPLERLMPIMGKLIKKARVRAPHATCLLDGFPLNAMQLDCLETGDSPFDSCVYAHTFVCKVPEAVAVDRAVKNGRRTNVPEESIYRFAKIQQDAQGEILDGMRHLEELTPYPFKVRTLRRTLQQGGLRGCIERACGPVAKIHPDDIAKLQRDAKKRTQSGRKYETNEAIKAAIIEKIIEAEKAHLPHWLMPADRRVVEVNTGSVFTPAESFAMLHKQYAETQFIIQQHVCKLALHVDKHNVAMQNMYNLAESEEYARQMSIEVAKLLTLGGEASEIQSFNEAVNHLQKAYTIAVDAQYKERERKHWENEVQVSSSRGVTPFTKGRWRPPFPSTLMVETPERAFAADDWTVPINPFEIKRALTYSLKAKTDFDGLVDARIEAEDLLVTGNAAVEARDLDTASVKFEKALSFQLTERRFTHDLVDIPLMEKLQEAFDKVKQAIKVRDQAREECTVMLEQGEAALKEFDRCLWNSFNHAMEHEAEATKIYTAAVKLAVESTHDAQLTELTQEGLAKAEQAAQVVSETKQAKELCEKATQQLAAKCYTESLELAKQAEPLAHSREAKQMREDALNAAAFAVAERQRAVERATSAIEHATSALAASTFELAQLSLAVDTLRMAVEQSDGQPRNEYEYRTDDALLHELAQLRKDTAATVGAMTLIQEVETALAARDFEGAKAKTTEAKKCVSALASGGWNVSVSPGSAKLTARITELEGRINDAIAALAVEPGSPG